ncbi:MAG: cytochrome b/b6 domain-containing protein [Corallincola sp.]|nr:cytochrome b/b6 domain-containing protein [Corallincola sp.]
MASGKLWDGYVRIFHWAQVGLIPALWWTAEEGLMDWHRLCAVVLLGLWLSRLLWGLVGSDTARFSQFVRGPKAVLAYLRSGVSPAPGHNPAGGYMVVLLLLVVGVQLATGLFLEDETYSGNDGPLNGWVSGATASLLAEIHEINFNILLGLIGLHIAAVVVYAVRGQRLVPPMISGGQAQGVRSRNGLWPLLLAQALIGVMLWGWQIGWPG